jgi:hypothetical protein
MSSMRIKLQIIAAKLLPFMVLLCGCSGAPTYDVGDGGYNRTVGPGAFALTGNENLAGGWDRLAEMTGLIYSHRDAIETDGGDAIQFNAGAYLELQDAQGIKDQCGGKEGVAGCEYDSGYVFVEWLPGQEFANVEMLAHEILHLECFQATGEACDDHPSYLFGRPNGDYGGGQGLAWQIADEWTTQGQ